MSLYSLDEVCRSCVNALWHYCGNCFKNKMRFCHCELEKEDEVDCVSGICPYFTKVKQLSGLKLDGNIVDAVQAWINHGLEPGSCTKLLLEGKYEEAYLHAHPLIKPYWEDHIAYIKSLPAKCRGENMKSWKGRLTKV